MNMDELDRSIVRILQDEGRISNADLARRVNLSPPAIHARLKRLEESGLISRYAALVNRQMVGYDMLCFVSVSLQQHQLDQVNSFREAVQRMPEVLECHHVTGEYDYLLKVVTRNTEDLESFLLHKLTPTPGVARIHTGLVLREVKNITAIPISKEHV